MVADSISLLMCYRTTRSAWLSCELYNEHSWPTVWCQYSCVTTHKQLRWLVTVFCAQRSSSQRKKLLIYLQVTRNKLSGLSDFCLIQSLVAGFWLLISSGHLHLLWKCVQLDYPLFILLTKKWASQKSDHGAQCCLYHWALHFLPAVMKQRAWELPE